MVNLKAFQKMVERFVNYLVNLLKTLLTAIIWIRYFNMVWVGMEFPQQE